MNIYLDCGFYVGIALYKYMNRGVVNNDWKIYAFEPGPELELDVRLQALHPKIELIKKAVWIKDGKVSFWISVRENASHIARTSSDSENKKIMVDCIDFSKFVAELPEAYIICSMDIEGSEFKVLDKMIKEGTIGRINELDIEFHHRLMKDYTDVDTRKLIKRLNEHGVKVTLKESLV